MDSGFSDIGMSWVRFWDIVFRISFGVTVEVGVTFLNYGICPVMSVLQSVDCLCRHINSSMFEYAENSSVSGELSRINLFYTSPAHYIVIIAPP